MTTPNPNPAALAAEGILHDYHVRAVNVCSPLDPKPNRNYSLYPEVSSERIAAIIAERDAADKQRHEMQMRAERAEAVLSKAGRALTGKKYVTFQELDEYLLSIEADNAALLSLLREAQAALEPFRQLPFDTDSGRSGYILVGEAYLRAYLNAGTLLPRIAAATKDAPSQP